jgi:endoglucanase
MDRSIIGNPRLIRYVEEVAKKNKIKFTYDALTGGGTDAGAIHLSEEGVITMTLSIPSRYIHSHYSVVNVQDLIAGKELIKEFVKAISKADIENKLKIK